METCFYIFVLPSRINWTWTGLSGHWRFSFFFIIFSARDNYSVGLHA